MTFRTLFLLLLLPLVASCGTDGRMDMADADEAGSDLRPMVMSFTEMKFTRLDFPGTYTADVTVADSTFDFGNGDVSYFKAFELPVREEAYVFQTIAPWYHYDCFPCSAGMFYASILVLDAEKNPLANVPMIGPVLLHRSSAPIWRRSLAVRVEPDSGARYAVVYTTRAGAAGTQRVPIGGSDKPGVAYAGGVFFPVPAAKLDLDGKAVGVLSVHLAEPGGMIVE